MTVLASEGVLGFGPQSAMGTLATTFYRHKASNVAFGPQQAIQYFPPEVGGGFHPTGAFKQMVFAGGTAVVQPRLEDVIGWLLYAVAGQHSVFAGGVPEAGMVRHRFRPPDNARDMPWISLRRYIPGAENVQTDVGEIMLDCRASGVRFTLAPGQILSTNWTFQGREPDLAVDIGVGEAHAWAWGNTYETYESVPLAHQGSLRVPLDESAKPSTGLTVDIINRYTTPGEELIIGSPYPDDFVLLTQSLVASWVYKWHNPTLYRRILTFGEVADGVTGYIDWSPIVYTDSMEFIATSPANVVGRSNPYRIRMFAPEITWQSDGPPALVGGGWLALRFIGTAMEQTLSRDYFQIDLDNEVANYAWP